jgi:hypothetical protein
MAQTQGRSSLQRDELWKLLVDTVHALPMYNQRKHYVQDVMLKEKPEISAKELAIQVDIPLGEAVVMLDELRNPASTTAPSEKPATRTLLDFER